MVKLYSGKVCDLQLASEEEDIAGSLSFLKGKEKELLQFLIRNYRGEFTPIEVSRELSVSNKTVINPQKRTEDVGIFPFCRTLGKKLRVVCGTDKRHKR